MIALKERGRDVTRALAVAASSLSLLGLLLASTAVAADSQKFKPGDTAPDFTLQDTSGKEFSLSGFAGKDVVVLAFFSLRCGTCIAEAPHLENLHKKYGGKGMTLLAINTDGADAATTITTMKEVGFNISYSVLLDLEFLVTDTYTNFLVPLTIVVDRKGIIRYIHTGYEDGEEKEYEKAIKKALKS